MKTRTLDDLREHLFQAVERLEAAKTPEALDAELKRSKAVSDLGRVMVETGKLESAHIERTGGQNVKSKFLQSKTVAQIDNENEPRSPKLVGDGRR